MQIVRARLQTAADSLGDVARFYGGLPVRAGTTEIDFEPIEGERPFYHFAFRVPRNRFEAARSWLADQAGLLPGDGGETTFEFDFWNAQACYALDPGENIVELIAHRELPDESPIEAPFTAAELLGMSELGLVVADRRAVAEALASLGIELRSGNLDEPGGLAFLGDLDGQLILSDPGRGWLPTGRPAEFWPVDVTVAGSSDASAAVDGHVVRTVRR